MEFAYRSRWKRRWRKWGWKDSARWVWPIWRSSFVPVAEVSAIARCSLIFLASSYHWLQLSVEVILVILKFSGVTTMTFMYRSILPTDSSVSFLELFFDYEETVVSFRNCLCGRYFTSAWRGIGYSFQLAIITSRMNLIDYDTATAQS